MISWEQALQLVTATPLRPLRSETVELEAALGRVSAADIVAAHDQPSEARSTMDGIAVADRDLGAGTTLELLAPRHAGSAGPAAVGAAQAVPVATGAAVPVGARKVIPREHYRVMNERVVIERAGQEADFIRPRGADFAAGETLVRSGQAIDPRTLCLVAAANRATVDVVRRPTALLICNGDELIAPGETLGPGKTVDSVSFLLVGLLREWGADPARLPLLPDDLAAITQALTQAAGRKFDLLVMVGGASVGTRDFARSAATAAGYQLLFEKVDMQPGRPCWFARHDNGTLLLGLPGNPVSAFVCAELFARRLLARMLGREIEGDWKIAQLGGDVPLRSGSRFLFARGTIRVDDGLLVVTPLRDQDSGLQRMLAQSTALIEVPPETAYQPGDRVHVHLLTTSTGLRTFTN